MRVSSEGHDGIRGGLEMIKGDHVGKNKYLKLRPDILFKLVRIGRRTFITKHILRAIFRKLNLRVDLPIDLHNSIAFAQGETYGIFVKEKDIINKIVSALDKVECVEWVKRSNEVFNGPFLHRAPDILVKPLFDKGCMIDARTVSGEVLRNITTPRGNHHPYGVLLIHERYYNISIKSLLDMEFIRKLKGRVPPYLVTPLIMHIFNVPLPHDTDAKDYLRIKKVRLKNYNTMWLVMKRIHTH